MFARCELSNKNFSQTKLSIDFSHKSVFVVKGEVSSSKDMRLIREGGL